MGGIIKHLKEIQLMSKIPEAQGKLWGFFSKYDLFSSQQSLCSCDTTKETESEDTHFVN